MIVDWGDAERRLTGRVSVLIGADEGRYPSGNSLVVRGDGEAVIIDPSVTVVEHGGVAGADRRRDRVAQPRGPPGRQRAVQRGPRPHPRARPAGRPQPRRSDGRVRAGRRGARAVHATRSSRSSTTPRAPTPTVSPTATCGTSAATQVEAVHLPGHTRGHSGFRISGGVFFLSDIDLTGFGPYYGDVWSDLEDFERSLDVVRGEEADVLRDVPPPRHRSRGASDSSSCSTSSRP